MVFVYKPLSRHLLQAVVALLLSATGAFSSEITLSDQSATPGTSVVSQISFVSQSSTVSGVQFDVQYDNSVISLAATLADEARSSGKNLYSVDLTPNRKRFLIIGLNQALIPDGILLNLSVNIGPSAPVGVYALSFSNVGGTDPDGHAVVVTGSDGTITVAQQATGKVRATLLGATGVSFDVPPLPPLYAPAIQTGIGSFGLAEKPSAQILLAATAETYQSGLCLSNSLLPVLGQISGQSARVFVCRGARRGRRLGSNTQILAAAREQAVANLSSPSA